MGTNIPAADDEQFFFFKPPATTVVGPDVEVPYPGETPVDLDWEAELAVVIGTSARHVSPEQVLDHVAGYTAANDLLARGLFKRSSAVMEPFGWDWLRHKAIDGSCPLGPGLVPHWLVDDPKALRLSLEVNGVVKQDSSTSDMVVDVAHLIAGASRVLTLQPGDVILTGTPAGVGMPNGDFLYVGDAVTVNIESIGRLTTTIGAPASGG
jgi:2-keto-4-pentenoate hydratase/2-oxohepta-3-ene-1,7-dioic acid hydratase in catechol pathway